MIYDGKDLGRWLRVNPTRRMAPPVVAESEDVPGRDGAAFRSARLGPLEITVACRLAMEHADAAWVARTRRVLAAAIVKDSPRELVLPDEPTLAYMALLTDASEMDNLWDTGGCTLTFTAYDPVAYGAARTRALAVGTESAVGIGGTYPTRPTFTVVGNGSVPQVTDTATGDTVRLAATLANGKTCVIDCGERRATVDGAPVAVTLDSDYIEVAPRTARLRASGCRSATMAWRERWL